EEGGVFSKEPLNRTFDLRGGAGRFRFWAVGRDSAAVSGLSGRHFPSSRRKTAAGEEEIGECEQGEYLRAVLDQPAVANLAIAELALQHAKDVLDLGAHRAETTIAGALTLREIAARLRLFLHAPQRAGGLRRALLRIARVAFVAVHGRVILADE